MMKTAFLFFLFAFIITPSIAQDFKEAPAPNVQKIIEWYRDMKDSGQEVFKGDVYLFQKDGKLANYKGWDWNRDINYYYDKQGRIEKVEETDERRAYTTTYAYKKRYYVEQWESYDFITKTFFYVNKKKQVIERKEFQKDLDNENPSFKLSNRTIYTYTSKDSLQGETYYKYGDGDPKYTKSNGWTIYTYDSETGKLKLVQNLNRDNEVTYFYDYEYDEQGRLASIMGRSGDGEYDHLTEHLYKDGKIWQKIETSRTENRIVTVYKDGIPIRNRYYERKDYDGFFTNDPKAFRLIQISDFQYVYY